MQKELTCAQVSALITYYLEDKLNYPLKEYVEQHLSTCKKCNEKYQKLLKINDKFSKNNNETDYEIQDNNYHTKQRHEDFRLNLSAYVDNELSDEENIRIKKIAITNPTARKDLEEFYTFKKLLHSSFDKTKNELKHDYSGNIIGRIYSLHSTNRLDPFYLIMTIFTVIIGAVLLGIANFFL